MKNQGPPLEAMIDRLISIPGEFINNSTVSRGPGTAISVPALVNDLLLDNGGSMLSDNEISKFFPDKTVAKTRTKDNYPGVVSILCYIYEDKFFTEKKSHAQLIKKFLLSESLIELSKAVESADDFINDPERREEICRRALDALNYCPMGENEKNSADRLLTLDSVERKKILIKTGEAQIRAKQIRDAMMRKEAEEAASKMSRE